MSVRKTIEKYDDPRAFRQLLARKLRQFNNAFACDFSFRENSLEKLAAAWSSILSTKYNFLEPEFSMLIDEIVGELVAIIISSRETLFERDRVGTTSARADFGEVHRHAPEYLALEVALEIVRECFQNKYVVPKPIPQKILEVAVAIRAKPGLAHRYWSMLGLSATIE